MSDVSNPFSVGAGGSNFEAKVQACFVTSMIVGAKLPCVPPSRIETIRLQAREAGYQTDDIVASSVASDGKSHRLLVQVKHFLTFTEGDSDYAETIKGAWADYNNTSLFDQNSDAIAIVTGPQSATVINHFRPVLEWARHCASSAEFFKKIAADGFASARKEKFVDDLRNILSAAPTPPRNEDEVWHFISRLHTLSFDFDVAQSQDEARVLSLIDFAKVADCKSPVDSLWMQIQSFTRDANQSAGTITKENLSADLPLELRKSILFRGPSDGSSRLASHTELVLGRISDELAPGLSIDRSAVSDLAVDLIANYQVLIVTGDAGDGKSAIAKQTLTRLATTDHIQTFAFRIEEFDFPHIDGALAAMGVGERFYSAIAHSDMLQTKIVFVDSVERLFELSHTDAFGQLLSIIAADRSLRLILSCRSQATPLLTSLFLLPSTLSVETIRVPRFTEDQVAGVLQELPQLRQFASDSRFSDLLRIPFYLKIACTVRPIDLAQKADGAISAIDLRRAFWHAIVERHEEQADGMPARRATAFVQVAVKRATSMKPYVRAEGIDPAAVQRLLRDDLVAQNDRGLYAPAQDLLEDWALYEHIESCFDQSAPDWPQFLTSIGDGPALRRAFRVWLTSATLGSDAERASDFAIGAMQNDAVDQHWRDDLLVAIFMSDEAARIVPKLDAALIANNKKLLIRAIHLLRTACKGPSTTLLRFLGISNRNIDPILAVTFTQATGGGWAAMVQLIARHLEAFALDEAVTVETLLTDWSNALDLSAALPQEATDAVRIAAHYFGLLTEENIYARDLEKKYLGILTKLPHADPELTRRLYSDQESSAIASNHRRSRSRRPRRHELLDEFALQSLTCIPLCQHFPEMVMAAAHRCYFNSSEDHRYYDGRIGLETAFGLTDDYTYRYQPPSAFQGPFLSLLTWHPEQALPFVLGLIERSAESYAASWPREVTTVKFYRGRGRPKLLKSSIRLWCAYRGTQVAPQLFECALMAMERWLLGLLEKKQDTSPYLAQIINGANTVAPIAVLASVASAYPELIGPAAIPLLGTIEFLEMDHQRSILDQQHTSDLRDLVGIPHSITDDVHYNERKDSDALKHRKLHLEGLAFKLQFGSLRKTVLRRIDRLKIDHIAEGDKTSPARRLLLKRIDTREHETTEVEGGVIFTPRVTEPELAAVVDRSQERLGRMSARLKLHHWATARFNNEPEKIESTKSYFLDWKHALAEAQRISSEDVSTTSVSNENDWNSFQLRTCTLVAAYLVRDFLALMDAGQLTWCVDEICTCLAENADSTDVSVQAGLFSMHGSRPAALALPALLKLDDKKKKIQIRFGIATAVTHAAREIRRYAAAGIRHYLWTLDPVYATHILREILSLGHHRLAFISNWRSKRLAKHAEFEKGISSLVQTARKSIARKSGGSDSSEGAWGPLLNNVHQEELLVAILLSPSHGFSGLLAPFFVGLLSEMTNTEVVASVRGQSSRDPVEPDIRQAFSERFAEFLLRSTEEPEDNGALDAVIAAVKKAPNLSSDILEHLLTTEDRISSGARFWRIWTTCAAIVFPMELLRKSDRLSGYREVRKLLRTLLLAEASWKPRLENWEPLKNQRDFIARALEQVADTPAGFSAMVVMLNRVARFALPDALIPLEDARRRSATQNTLENESSQQELEILLRDCVLKMGATIRMREVLHRAVLGLLDHLVNRGSSLAFQLRDMLVAPTSR